MHDNILNTVASQCADHLKFKTLLNISTLGGDLGTVCFLLEYSRYQNSLTAYAEDLLGLILKNLGLYCNQLSYCNGLSGLGIALHLLEEDGLIQGADSSLSYIDNILLQSLRQTDKFDQDFLHGDIGKGFYFLMRLPYAHQTASEGICLLVKQLWKNRIAMPCGITWATKNNDLEQKFNISISHGESAIAIFLSKIINSANYLSEDIVCAARSMLLEATNFILAQKIAVSQQGSNNLFPATWKYPNDQTFYSRLAWCYGDLGVAIALFRSAKALNDNRMRNEAIAIALHCTQRVRDCLKTNVNKKRASPN